MLEMLAIFCTGMSASCAFGKADDSGRGGGVARFYAG